MLEGFDLLVFELLVICNVFSILTCKPDKTKGKEQDRMRNKSHENLHG